MYQTLIDKVSLPLPLSTTSRINYCCVCAASLMCVCVCARFVYISLFKLVFAHTIPLPLMYTHSPERYSAFYLDVDAAEVAAYPFHPHWKWHTIAHSMIRAWTCTQSSSSVLTFNLKPVFTLYRSSLCGIDVSVTPRSTIPILTWHGATFWLLHNTETTAVMTGEVD